MLKLLSLHSATAKCNSFEELGIKLGEELNSVIPGFYALRIPIVEGEAGKEQELVETGIQLPSEDMQVMKDVCLRICRKLIMDRESVVQEIAEIAGANSFSKVAQKYFASIAAFAVTDSRDELTDILVFLLPSSNKITDELTSFLEKAVAIITPVIEKIHLLRAYRETEERSEALMKVSQIISGKLQLRELLTVLARQCSWLLNADRTTVWLYDEENEEIWTIVGEGLHDEIRMPVGKGIAGNVAKTLKTLNIADPYSHPLFNPDIDKQTGYKTKSILCMPLLNKKGELIGVYQVLNKLDHPHFTKDDEELLAALSGSASIAIENAHLYEEQRKQFNSFIEVLATSVDAKDPTTANHSKIVTGVSVAIAKQMGFPPQKVELIRIAAVLHDYGKIGVPDAILCKPGELDDTEFKVMRSHVSKTIEILSKVYFSKEMKDVPRIAGTHHERLDGKGYPLGLKSDEIPIEGRILAVADIFHALLQERPYKRAFHPKEALEYCKKLTGKHRGRFGEMEGVHLDAQVVEALEKVLERENYNISFFIRESGWSDAEGVESIQSTSNVSITSSTSREVK